MPFMTSNPASWPNSGWNGLIYEKVSLKNNWIKHSRTIIRLNFDNSGRSENRPINGFNRNDKYFCRITSFYIPEIQPNYYPVFQRHFLDLKKSFRLLSIILFDFTQLDKKLLCLPVKSPRQELNQLNKSLA